MRTRSRALTLVEVMIVCGLFAMLAVLLGLSLRQVSLVSSRTSGRDDALRQILKARSALARDLANSSRQDGQFATARVGPNLGAGYDGDALTFLSSDDGTGQGSWSVDPSTGQAVMASQITYYLVIPNAANAHGINAAVGPADAAGYEQQDPCKWLIRSVDPVVAPTPPATVPGLDPNWTTWLTRPSTPPSLPEQRLVADQLLSFRVLQEAPVWSIELKAVAIEAARREIAVGKVPLGQSRFTLVQQVTVAAGN